MANVDIVFIDNYKVPGLAAMVVDIVYKNNTSNYIQIAHSFMCGSITRSLGGTHCIPPFATSGYYLFRSANLQTCAYSGPVTIYRCGDGIQCPTVATCAWGEILTTGTIPVYRIVTEIPSTSSVLASLPNIIATNIIANPTSCVESCSTTVNVTWVNIGGSTGVFIPAIVVDGVKTSFAPETLTAGQNFIRSFYISGLMRGTHIVCPDPN